MGDKTAPNSQLKLEWIYGYRGFQCRNNVKINSKDDLVYFVAAVGVVYETKEHKQKFYLGHDDDIISLAIHPEKRLVATGQIGKNPQICVWDSHTLETMSLLQNGHTHGISSVAFNENGTRLVSVGMDQNSTLNVWEWQKGKILSTIRAHSDRVFDCQFRPGTSDELVTCGVKHIKFWSLTGNTLTAKKGIFGKVGEIQTMLSLAFGPAGTTYAGTITGSIYVWNGNNLENVIKGAHVGAIHSMEGGEEGFITGGKDGVIQLFDSTFHPMANIDLKETPVGYQGLVFRSVSWKGERIIVGTQGGEIFELSLRDRDRPVCLVAGHAEGELWALAVHPKKPIVATGSDDQTLRLWLITDHEMLLRTTLDHKIRSCAFNEDGSLLAVGLDDGSFTVYKSKDLAEVVHMKERKEVIHEMKFSPDGKLLAVGSNDNFVDIYDVLQKYKKVGECRGNSSFITHLDWSVDSKYIRTNSGAAEMLVFKAPAGKQVTSSEELKLIKWHSLTGVLGEEVNGIWEKYTDTNDVNAVHVNTQSNVVVTGDDFGLVKLFRFPSKTKGARFRKYVGHSAHVTNIRWSHDNIYVLSTGGADCAMFQWKFVSGDKEAADFVDAAVVNNGGAFTDSNTEGSDTDYSDVEPINSDVEKETSCNYSRNVYREDLKVLEQVQRQEMLRDGKKRKKAPSQGLKLEFVHGYRGYDCRNNLFYTSNWEVVYHIAALGVVYNKDNHTQRFYSQHTDDILCLALHPVKDYVATGQVGRDPAIHVWDVESLSTLSILKGQHERGICALDFSMDGRKLASVGIDDNHTIVIWDWRKGEKLATTRGNKDKIFVIKWSTVSNDDLVTVGVRHIRFWKQAGGGFTSNRGTFGTVAKLETQLCAAYSPDGTCYTGGASGKICVWKGNQLERTVDAHEGGCFAMHSLDKGFVTGGKDGTVSLYDETFSKVYKSYSVARSAMASGSRGVLMENMPTIRAAVLGHHRILVGTRNGEIVEIEREGPMRILVQGHTEGEVWGLCAHPSLPICASVSHDGTLRVWAVVQDQHRLMNAKGLKRPAQCVDISFDGQHIAVGFRDGSFTVYKFDTLDEVSTEHPRKEEISDIKFSPDPGKYLAVASHDNFVDIYNLITRQRVGVCKGASSYITHIDWNTEGKLIMLNSGAKEQLFFESPRGTRQTPSRAEIDKISWNSWTCVLGDTCLGVWPPKSDVTDVNGAHMSNDGALIATGDDFGYVKLFDYPCKTKFAKYKQYVGHSAHVTNVRWLFNDSYLISSGGADTAIMVWRHRYENSASAMLQNGEPGLHSQARQGGQDNSDLSDTDSEEEGGYDSDVNREKNMDYASKTYAGSLKERQGIKPNERKDQDVRQANPLKKSATRNAPKPPKIQPPTLLNSSSSQNKKATSRRPNASNYQNGSSLESVTDLELVSVLGYRGFDCRNNLHYLDLEGTQMVYHAAGAAIVQNLANGTQSFYLEHSDDILCLAVNRHPKHKSVVATGQLGEAPPILVWDASTVSTLSCLKSTHTDGVCALDFSCSGKLLLSVGLDAQHIICVWRWQEGTLIASEGGNSQRILHAEFRPDSDSSFVSVGVKHVKFWTVAGNQLVYKRGSVVDVGSGDVRMTTMLSVAFGMENLTFTGTMSGDVWVWKDHTLHRIVPKVHTGPVFTLYTTLADGLIVSGGKEKGKDSGVVKLWDQEMRKCKAFHIRGESGLSEGKDVVKSVCRAKGKILVGTKNSEIVEISEKSGNAEFLVRGHTEGELWGLTCHPGLHRFATASDDGTVRIWDLNTKSMVHCLHTGAARSVHYSPNGDYLAVGLKSGGFLILQAETLKLMTKRRDRGKSVADIRFSPCCQYLAVGSEENCVDIYGLQIDGTAVQIERLGYCKAIPSFVIQMDFSADSKYLRVSTGEYTHLYYSVPAGEPITDEKLIDEITWSTWTSILGNEVKGVWPDGAAEADVNCASVSRTATSVVTGDDYGLVKLFEFPCPEQNASHKKYVGHSAHVTNVRFTHDDNFLISTGGDDCCVFVWKCK